MTSFFKKSISLGKPDHDLILILFLIWKILATMVDDFNFVFDSEDVTTVVIVDSLKTIEVGRLRRSLNISELWDFCQTSNALF